MAGRRPALEAVRSGLAREVLVSDGARRTPALRDVLSAAEAARIPVRRAPAARIHDLADGARDQGVVARVRPPPSLREVDLERRRWASDAVVVVLDGVTDPHNVGAVARSAEAAGAAALVVRRRRGSGLGPGALRASAGALLVLPVAEVANLARAVDRLRGAGFWAVGLEAAAPRALGDESRPAGRVALILGSEGEGLSRLVRERCDELVGIPLRGRIASLNVSVAAGIALFSYTAGR